MSLAFVESTCAGRWRKDKKKHVCRSSVFLTNLYHLHRLNGLWTSKKSEGTSLKAIHITGNEQKKFKILLKNGNIGQTFHLNHSGTLKMHITKHYNNKLTVLIIRRLYLTLNNCYSFEGQLYWNSHPSKRRPNKSRYPEPNSHNTVTDVFLEFDQ
jgi:hypothetical protein